MAKKLKDQPEKLQPFLFHGAELDIRPKLKTVEGTCPLCSKEGHFYVKVETGQWSCKRCGEDGNIPTFLRKLWELGRTLTHDRDLQKLSEDRGISVRALKAWGIVVHPIRTGDWLIPGWNAKGSLATVYRITKMGGDSWRAMGTPHQLLHPFRPLTDPDMEPGSANKLQGSAQGVVILEGVWDGPAFWDMGSRFKVTGPLTPDARLISTRSVKQSLAGTHRILGAPGAGTFQESWAAYCDKLPTWAFYDNDHAKKGPTGKLTRSGWDGMQRLKKVLGSSSAGRPKSLHLIHWGPASGKGAGFNKDLPDGFDTRDLLVACGHPLDRKLGRALKRTDGSRLTPKAALEILVSSSKEVKLAAATRTKRDQPDEEPALEPLERTRYRDLCGDFDDKLHFTPAMKDTLAVMLAVVTSTDLEGDQLFLRVRGPAGSGKTTLAECIGAAKDYTINRSVITGFHSGFVDPDARKTDSSLIPQLDGKTFIVKDADTLIQAPNRDKILSELRDLYDGTSRAQYRNRKTAVYEGLRTTFILCGTDELLALNRTFLGERFLDCEILGDAETTAFLDTALDNAFTRVTGSLSNGEERHHGTVDNTLRRATLGFIQHLKTTLRDQEPPAIPPSQRGQIKAMGQVLSILRAKPRREQGTGDITYRPRAELATRIVSQLVKLGICLALVLGKKAVDREVIRILRKVVLDTAEGFTLEIVRVLANHPDGLSAKQMAHTLKLAESTVRRTLQDLHEFEVVDRQQRPNNSGIRGRHLHLWTLEQTLKDLWVTGLGTQGKAVRS